MGNCFPSAKLQQEGLSSMSYCQAEKSHGASMSSSCSEKLIVQFSDSHEPPGNVGSKGSWDDNPLPDLYDLNSDAIACLINPTFHPSKAKQLFSRSSNASVPIFFRDNGSTEISYTQYISLYEHQNPTEILPTIFLGSKEDSEKVTRLKEIGITHILCVMSGQRHEVQGCKLLTVAMADKGNSQLEDIMKRTFPFIEESQQKGNKLLIHCNSGQNRSPTLLISWLMSKNSWTFYHAHKYVKQARAIIQPNKSYVDQLRALDKKLFGIYSTPEDYLSICLTEGELTIADSFPSAKRSAYKSAQLSVMSPQQLTVYQKSKEKPTLDLDESFVLTNHDGHKSTELQNT